MWLVYIIRIGGYDKMIIKIQDDIDIKKIIDYDIATERFRAISYHVF